MKLKVGGVCLFAWGWGGWVLPMKSFESIILRRKETKFEITNILVGQQNYFLSRQINSGFWGTPSIFVCAIVVSSRKVMPEEGMVPLLRKNKAINVTFLDQLQHVISFSIQHLTIQDCRKVERTYPELQTVSPPTPPAFCRFQRCQLCYPSQCLQTRGGDGTTVCTKRETFSCFCVPLTSKHPNLCFGNYQNLTLKSAKIIVHFLK